MLARHISARAMHGYYAISILRSRTYIAACASKLSNRAFILGHVTQFSACRITKVSDPVDFVRAIVSYALSSTLMAKSYEYSEGGYDYEFVDTLPDTLVCKICHYPSREPHLSVCCGHTFCKSCLKNAKKSTVLSDVCPMCRSNQFTTVPNKQNERAVLSLKVLCTNTKRGCDWIGEVNDITSHLRNSSGCKYENVSCSNGCGKTMERRCMDDHVKKKCTHRLTNCPYCGIVGKHQYIEGTHKRQCYRFPVQCPNKCEIRNVPSKHLKEHMKACPLEVVQCQYHNVGCEAKMARKDMVKHDEEKANEHLLLMKSTLIDTQSKLADAEQRLASAEIKLEANYTEVLAKVEAKFQSKIDTAVQNRISELGAILEQKTKLIDMLFGEWLVKIHTRAAKLSSCNQLLPVIVKMPDFMMKNSNKVDWYGGPFFTHHNGYKMRLNVVPAGHGTSEGLYMSVYLYIMEGPFDHLLKWQLRGKFQIKLLNQICDSKHHSASYHIHASRNQSRPFWYSEEFIPCNELCKVSATCQYVKDDCLFFEVCRLS